jgi:hypothetical protein
VSANLEWFQAFYLSLCDGEWEHSFGCTIGNIDNPGWSFSFELADTVHADRDFPEISTGDDQVGDGPDWVLLRKVDTAVEGACGPLKLDQLLGHFRLWIEGSAT